MPIRTLLAAATLAAFLGPAGPSAAAASATIGSVDIAPAARPAGPAPADRIAAIRRRHAGEVLARVLITDPRQLDRLDAAGCDQWTHGHQAGWHEFRLDQAQLELVRRMGLRHEVVREDVAELLAAEAARLAAAGDGAAVGGADFFADYRPLDVVASFTDTLAATHPELASVVDLGQSLEGRPIRGLRITGPGDATNRPAVLINALQHAREWITVPTVLWFAQSMLEGYGQDPEITAILDAIELHVIPVTNPDGYVWSWDENRLWRKNRRDNGDGSFGVDLNRNWSFQWGGQGASENPSSATYRGTGPFSEPESTVLSQYILDLGDVAAHLDVHSYGQLILSPFGYDFVEPEGVAGRTHLVLGRTFADYIAEVSGAIYDPGPAWGLYLASGTCSDWAHGGAGAISFTFELRPANANEGGFVLPPEAIEPTATENREAFLDLCRAVAAAVRFNLPDGLPPFLVASDPEPIAVFALPVASADLLPATATALVSVPGQDVQSVPLSPTDDLGGYTLALPPLPCGGTIGLAFEIQSADGLTYRHPTAPEEFLPVLATEPTVLFADDAETDPGWTVEDVDVSTGTWERGVPAHDGSRGDPVRDADNSGSAWLTGNGDGNPDLDGGPTRLISPTIDLSMTPDPRLQVARWMSNDDGDADRLRTFLSDDDGASWVEVDAVNNLDGWQTLTIRVADHVLPTATVRLRFDADDNPNNSVTEAGIDAIRLLALGCPGSGPDIDGDGSVGFTDLLAVLGAWGPCVGCTEDVDGDGLVGLSDLLEVLAAFG
ncbi:MAG: M14 family zinc carboxypeptidase [Planctomycetota bacterium]|jgi:hypothetical protein